MILICLNRDILSLFALRLLLGKNHSRKIYYTLSEKIGRDEPPEILKTLAKSFNLSDSVWPTDNYLSIKNINSAEALSIIQRLNIDLIISIRYGQIFKTPIISSIKHGIINLHSGRLPEYRGIMASFWAMKAGDKVMASTLHYIENSGIDCGAIIKIDEFQNCGSFYGNMIELYRRSTTIIADIFNSERITLQSYRQDLTNAKYYGYPSLDDIVLFEKAGNKLITDQDYKDLCLYRQ